MALNDDLRTLSSLAAFRDLEPDALRLIGLSAETRILRAGDVLFRLGDTSNGGFILLSGTLTLDGGTPEPVVVAPPTLVGEAALLATTRRPATATAREPSSVLAVSRELYRRVLSEYPGSARRVHGMVARRVSVLRQNCERLGAGLPEQ